MSVTRTRAIHLPAQPACEETRCGLPITSDVKIAAIPLYADCGACLSAARHGHEGAREDAAVTSDGQAYEVGYGHGV